MAKIRASLDLALAPAAAFPRIVEQLVLTLARMGIRFEPGPGGRVAEGVVTVGDVTLWDPPERIVIRWHPMSWDSDTTTELELRWEAVDDGTRILLEHRDWDQVIGEPANLADWFAGQVLGPLVGITGPRAVGDWITDRLARRPSGEQARGTYRDPLYHYPNFRVILAELALTADDYLLEVGCGGGALLQAALRSGCRAAAVDHSPDMVRVARDGNRAAVDQGRLRILEASANALPFPNACFTCVAMTGVLGFLTEPVGALAEIRRVLEPGGRFVGLGSDPELRGTPGAPEPMASRLQFYGDDELEALGRRAGFAEVRVIRRNLAPFAREAGVPDEHLALFEGPGAGARFLLARQR